MNRAEKVKALFLANVGRRVTNRMIAEAGVPTHTARNATAECKKLLPGYAIRYDHKYGQPFMDSGWVCSPAPKTSGGQFEFAEMT